SVFPDGKGQDADLVYNIAAATKQTKPGLYYWSKRYQYQFGIKAIKNRTDILRQHLPNAGIGANYSPHYPQEHMFLGEVFKWVSVFRESGMTLPWSEDYIWQVSVGTPQMNNINLDLFRAANRHHPDRKIMYYVMPHMPNNTPNQWRRLFYGAIAHGMKIVDLFEFRPAQVAYTENHVDEPPMYRMTLGSFRELGLFEDIVQDGQVRGAEAALWFSETGDIWGDSHGSLAAGKRALYIAIRQQQLPLDFVVEQDALDGTLSKYKVLYLADAHVSSAASQKIAAWVQGGGQLFATAGAGLFDELNRPNKTLRDVLGVEPAALEEPTDSTVTWIKQDLPFAKTIDLASMPVERVRLISPRQNEKYSFPVLGVRGRFKAQAGSEVYYRFGDGSPAVVHRKAGKGAATYCGLLPGLSYYHPAVPRRPVDRGATDDAMVHFLPTAYDQAVADLIASPAAAISRPVTCSQPLVETMVIESKHGVAIPLINWTPQPVKGLEVTVSIATPKAKVSLASGGPVKVAEKDGSRVYTFDLDVADALILR
ncbi:MAG: beta-galactosidase trimerization domain-containing protein, partial [Planctomycetota bacterium]|nr:beta-galactosidase trimerization domain-containing protein [Planctomycetota bacterium]